MAGGAEREVASYDLGIANKSKAIAAAAANLIHTLDAAHTARVANASRAAGLNFLANHDCFVCLAADATEHRKIVTHEFRALHENYDTLGLFHERNAHGANSIEPPERGTFDLREIEKSINAF
jgi:DNA-directed RNA polymerase